MTIQYESHSGINQGTNNYPVYARGAKSNQILKGLRAQILSFKEYEDGWDGPDSKGPTSDAIVDALEYLKCWKENYEYFEPELTYDGIIALQFYDSDGYTNGGIKFVGNGEAYYTLVNRTKDVDSSIFNSKSKREIFESITKIKSELKKMVTT